MLRGEDTSMNDLVESKFDLVLKAIEVLTMRINYIEDFITKFNTNQGLI